MILDACGFDFVGKGKWGRGRTGPERGPIGESKGKGMLEAKASCKQRTVNGEKKKKWGGGGGGGGGGGKEYRVQRPKLLVKR